jgi:hypothetical protein
MVSLGKGNFPTFFTGNKTLAKTKGKATGDYLATPFLCFESLQIFTLHSTSFLHFPPFLCVVIPHSEQGLND